jgi:hypothetical protein
MSVTYTYLDFGGVDNCTLCDTNAEVYEYKRNDGKAVLICRRCQIAHEL